MVKTDIASMANSLEVRCPFLDHEFVKFAATIPSWLKYDGIGGKIILKSGVKDLLLTEIWVKPKTGFGLPIAKWFRNDLAPMLKETLLDEISARGGLFEQHLLRKMASEHIGGRRRQCQVFSVNSAQGFILKGFYGYYFTQQTWRS
jgi:asparagine synthase (glutamine-hydrolysing)